MLDDPIAPHTVGGSGMQKLANFILITLIIGAGFLGLVAGLSGGFVDFKRIPHMLSVAFEGADFEPREEWTKAAAPAPVAVPEEPIRFESVVATPVVIDKANKVILVRGQVRNVADTAYQDVVVRGMLYDVKERPLTQTQTQAPLGARVLPSQITEQGSAADAKSLLPQSAALLASQSSKPFSLIITDVPDKYFENPDFGYRVEIADKKPQGGQPTEAAAN